MKQKPNRFGLMPVLDAALELPRTVLPLKSVRYQFVARGGMAEVEMTQIYRQENAQPLDCEYLFPLPADAAVYRCEASINGRVICARIEEREAARKIVAEKKAEGRRTALVESERDNLFTLSVETTDAIAQDYYFLVDRSGSMEGEKWQKAIHALHGCIAVLGPKDRVAVTLFESRFKDFDAAPASPVAIMADPRFRELAAVGTTGGTELAPALRHVLEQVARFSKERPAVLVLITDAQIVTLVARDDPEHGSTPQGDHRLQRGPPCPYQALHLDGEGCRLPRQSRAR